MENTKPLRDGCPEWAMRDIKKLYLLEVEAGVIKTKSKEDWAVFDQNEMERIASKLDRDDAAGTEVTADELFQDIVGQLRDEGFSESKIAAMINARMPTGCQLLYCNEQEVKDALNEA